MAIIGNKLLNNFSGFTRQIRHVIQNVHQFINLLSATDKSSFLVKVGTIPSQWSERNFQVFEFIDRKKCWTNIVSFCITNFVIEEFYHSVQGLSGDNISNSVDLTFLMDFFLHFSLKLNQGQLIKKVFRTNGYGLQKNIIFAR